jgi:hypothetical protein
VALPERQAEVEALLAARGWLVTSVPIVQHSDRKPLLHVYLPADIVGSADARSSQRHE